MQNRHVTFLLLGVGFFSLAVGYYFSQTCTLLACESHGPVELRRIDFELGRIYWNDGCNTCSAEIAPIAFGLASLGGAVVVEIGSSVVRRAA